MSTMTLSGRSEVLTQFCIIMKPLWHLHVLPVM